MLEQGLAITKAAENLGINDSMLSKCVRKYRSAKNKLAEAFPVKGHLAPSDAKM